MRLKADRESHVRERRASRVEERPWTANDRALLHKLHTEGYDSITTARKLGRSRADVLAEIEREGLDAGYEPDPMEKPIVERECLSCGHTFRHRTNRICLDCKDRVEFKSPVIGGYDISVRRTRRQGA